MAEAPLGAQQNCSIEKPYKPNQICGMAARLYLYEKEVPAHVFYSVFSEILRNT